MSYVYAVIPADPHARVMFHRQPEAPELAELQAAVGGYIQIVNAPAKKVARLSRPLHGPMTVFVDEDGISKRLPYNFRATGLVSSPELGTTRIFGDVVVMGTVAEGATRSLDDEQQRSLRVMDKAAEQLVRERRL